MTFLGPGSQTLLSSKCPYLSCVHVGPLFSFHGEICAGGGDGSCGNGGGGDGVDCCYGDGGVGDLYHVFVPCVGDASADDDVFLSCDVFELFHKKKKGK